MRARNRRQNELISQAAESGALDADLLKQCADVNEAMSVLKQQLQEEEHKTVALKKSDGRLRAIAETIHSLPTDLEKYDDALTAKLIKTVRITPAKIEVQFI